jgi:hypothetical protein
MWAKKGRHGLVEVYEKRTNRKFLYAMIRQMQQIRKPFFESLHFYAIGLPAANALDMDS